MNDTLIHLGLLDDEDIILDEAALALARLDHPDTDPAPYRAIVEAMALRLGAVSGTAIAASDRATALANIVGQEFGFTGDRATYDDPADADMIRVLDRRLGLPVSLSILYVGLARRLGWQADALDVPGHVLVMVGVESDPVIVDPFRDGVRVGHEQLAALLAASIPDPAPAVRHLAVMPNRAILVRLLLNQATRAEQNGNARRALDLYRRMTQVAPAYDHVWWERARLELVDADVPAARKSLSAMLEITRDPDLRSKVSGTLESLSFK